ncbi:MAG: hypothetical protein QNL62_12960 [Gammaproteobacteria bacterium]|nr:hypothetical protein [Gammaproteobacteria bacterium]
MLNKTLSCFWLLLFCTQTVLAGIDVHYGQQTDTYIDIGHHYIDDHNVENHCNFVSANGGKTENDKTTESELHHHACDGHIVSFLFENNLYSGVNYLPSTETFIYFINLHSITVLAFFKPPIFS